MLKALPLVVVLSASAIPVATFAVVKPSPPVDRVQPRSLAVQGDAQIRIVPDRATFTVTVEANDKDKTKVQQLVQERTAKVLEAATKNGISGSGITTQHIALQPEYFTDKHGDPIYNMGVKRWVATRTLTICVEDMKKMNAAFGAVIDAGGTIQGDVVFDTSRLEELRHEARRAAAEAARRKAHLLVDTLGGKLGKPITINETEPSWSGQINYKNAVEDWRSGAFVDGSFSAGQMTVSAHVNVSFDIES